MAGDTIREYLVGLGFDVDDASLGQVTAVMKGVSEKVTALGTVLADGVNGLKQYFGAARDESGAMREGAEAMEAFKGGVEVAADATLELTEAMKDGADSAQMLTDDVTEAASSTDKLADAAKDNARAMSEGAKSAKELTGQVERVDDAQRKAEEATEKATSAMEMYQKTVTVVQAAIAIFVASGIAEMVRGVARAEAELTKTARALKKTRDEARAYTTALEAMGVTAEDLAGDKKLRATHAELMKIGMAMKLPESSSGLAAVNGLANAFLHLKVIASYALKWIYHQILSVCEGPIKQFRTMFDKLNASLKIHMPSISKGVAEGISVLLRLAMTVIRVFAKVFDAIARIPKPVKWVVGALAGLWAIMKAGPFGWIMLVIAGVLLLIEDFFTYLDGGESLFGDFWGKLVEFIEWAQPYVDEFIDNFTKGLKEFVDWAKPHVTEFIDNFIAGLKTVGGWIKKFAEYMGGERLTALGLFAGAIWAVNAALNANPIVWIIGLIVGLIAAIGWVVKNADVLKEKLVEAWEHIRAACSEAWQKIVDAFKPAGEFFRGIWTNITEAFGSVGAFFRGVGAKIKAPFVTVVNWFTEKFKAVVKFIKDPFGSIKEFFSGKKDESVAGFDGVDTDIGSKFSGVPGKVSEAVSGMSDFASAAWTTISGALSGIAGDIGGWFEGIKLPSAEDISGFVSTAWANITGNLSNAAADIGGWFKGIVLPSGDTLSEFASTAWTNIKENFSGAAATIGAWFEGIKLPTASDISDFASSAWTTIEGKFSGAAAAIGNWFKGIDLSSTTSDLSTWATNAWADVQKGFGDVQQWFTDTFSGVGDTIKGAVGAVSDWAADTWESTKGLVEDTGNWFKNLFGWGEDANAQTEGFVDAAQEQKKKIVAAFSGADSDIAAVFQSMVTLSEPSIELIAMMMKTAYDKASKEFEPLPADVKSIFSKVSDSLKSPFDKAVSAFVDQVGKIKSALNSIPRNITVSVTTTGTQNPGFSEGGVIDREMTIRAGEQNKREYIIPITKPQRAIPLLRAAMEDLGMTPLSTRAAMKTLGGSATANALPGYAQTTNSNSSVVQHIDAHSEVKFSGTNPDKAAVREIERTQQNHVRNLKGVFG